MSETYFKFEVQPVIPAKLAGLNELSNSLLYTWDRRVRRLFYQLDAVLWESCGHNPKVFLRQVAQAKLDIAAEDNVFLDEYSRVMSSFNSYHSKKAHPEIDGHIDSDKDLIVYFCAEFGLHESVPIYSGGLGILAGDHCKAASDLGLPFIAIGLLYRQGYFTQTIDAAGNQLARNKSTHFGDLPISPVRDSDGNKLKILVDIEGRNVALKVWKADAGHITLYLLDSDLSENTEQDRTITFQLYGGDNVMRIQQEIVLGIGGVRAIRALGLNPNVWHINEGHSAFQILERCHEYITTGMDFDSAHELVASGTIFTTHTPVPAGHDIFDESMINQYLGGFPQKLNISMERFLSLGLAPNSGSGFNMTTLALHSSRFHNGVSRIHGRVASEMEKDIWPQIPPNENPISYVTNGVHAPTFLATEWINLFDMRFREWRNHLLDPDFWKCLDNIPDHRFWSLRQELKSQMLEFINQRVTLRGLRNGCSDVLLKRITQHTSRPESDLLVLGFARRFATYKRATLLFSDIERLTRLLNNPERPVLIIFAGKAHPNDIPGQELIRRIHDYSLRPEFVGKIILLEGYDMALGRKLVSGVDVWLNTPEYPLEASGTSGEKAAINGVLNVSVLDGWWGEGYTGDNGWGISPHGPHFDPDYRNTEEANDLLNILEHEVIPMFFDRDSQGYSKDWVKMSRASMKYCIPHFNAKRMLMDYVRQFYGPAKKHYSRLSADNNRPAEELANWKNKISKHWHGANINKANDVSSAIHHGETLSIKVRVFLNGLSPDDVAVECLIGEKIQNEFTACAKQQFSFLEQQGDDCIFLLELDPIHAGLNYYKLRMYPYHELLAHRHETGFMIWL
ncbi:Glycogen phosphorylase [hydrothermal vent metagenome]|uniref:Glycogen phosphorylase n=1 Tax=hydrothermal vent metagenome TaxID=652676 RepID=A0A3B1BDK7_9ZZZZ